MHDDDILINPIENNLPFLEGVKLSIIIEDELLLEVYKRIFDNAKINKSYYQLFHSKGIHDSLVGVDAMYDLYAQYCSKGRLEHSSFVATTVLFILDLDFSIFEKYAKYHEYKSNKNFLYLEKYSIENYFITKDFIIDKISTLASIPEEEVEAFIGYDEWIDYIYNLYSDLLPKYVYMKKNGSAHQIIKMDNVLSAFDYSDPKRPSIRVGHRINSLDKELSPKLKKCLYTPQTTQVCNIINENVKLKGKEVILDFIPGKQLLNHYLEYYRECQIAFLKCKQCSGNSCMKREKWCTFIISSEYGLNGHMKMNVKEYLSFVNSNLVELGAKVSQSVDYHIKKES